MYIYARNNMLKIYTDGACENNDIISDTRRGGYCAILLLDNNEKIVVKGKEFGTTNNRMELTAFIEGLKKVNELQYNDKITVFLDSNYVKNAFTNNWLNNWQKNNWMTYDKKEVKNKDLWLKLLELTKNKDIELIHVKGHSGNKYNEEADKIVVKEIYAQ